MTRKMIAFLALISGLVALSGATTASFAHASSPCDASVSASADDVLKGESIRDKRSAPKASARAERSDPKYRTPTPAALRAPVVMGIDRAYE